MAQFRPKIEEIAKLFSCSENSRAHTRFNSEKRCAEIYDKDGTIVFIAVKGEAGCPEKVIVTSDLPQKTQALFREAFPRLRVEFHKMSSLF